MKKNPRLYFGDSDFIDFRVNLLKAVDTQKRMFNFKQAQKEQVKADRCLTYLMNHQPHQQEF